MAIILTTQPSVSDEKTLNMLGDFGNAIGIPGFAQPNDDRKGVSSTFDALQNDINNVIDKLTGRSNQENFDPNFVGDGRQAVPGGNVQGGKVSPLEEANVRQVYSQTPHISVIIKKKAFSGLNHLYNPTLMDSAERWMLRAIKSLISSKCEAMGLYERLTKIRKLDQLGAGPGAILASLCSGLYEDAGKVDAFSSAMQLQRAQLDRQPPEFTTYHVDSSLPITEDLGAGNGVFEITTVSNVNTNIGIKGEGTASFEVEDPYRILIVTENDIEQAIRNTALSGFISAINSAAGLSLSTAQSADSMLQKSRQRRNKSEITFSVGVGGSSGVSAVIDAIGFELTDKNLDDVPDPHTLDDDEKTLFKSVFTNLKNYESALKKNFMQGLGNFNNSTVKEQARYTREKLRLYHLGKSIIQPMDSVHILIDGGTRRLGETGNIEDPNEQFNLTSVSGALNAAGNIFGLQNEAQVDDELLEIEWAREGQHMSFGDFKTLRTLQGSGEGGTHVFGGVVSSVTDKFDASSGKFILNVSCATNMEWLKISRFNTSPSTNQIQGIIYDPLTPFKIDTDMATGLPTGKPELSDENKMILNSGPKMYFETGEKIGTQVKTTENMIQDVKSVGGNLIDLYQHAPGLVYRWKPGIMTATYNMATTDPKDGTAVTFNQLRREVGFFSSNTPFDNMDAANVISLLVTGFPYDPVRFVQAAEQTGAFSKDNTYNDYKQYFHTFLDVQRSLNVVQGGFTPFKTLNISPADLAENLKIQQQLSNKSSGLQQLRNKKANLQDKVFALDKGDNNRIARTLSAKIEEFAAQEKEMENELLNLSGSGEFLQGSVLFVAGNDITVEIAGGTKDYKIFGDKLRHAVLRRREDIIRGRDSNYFIVSDEYDKDYDIQAFVLQLRQQSLELWKSQWESPYAICSSVAEALDFEFFTDTQGHIVFRPPQYNRTPATIMNNMFSMKQASGIDIIPDFLKKLFLSREQSLITDVLILEWEIILNASLLGLKDQNKIEEFIGDDEFFINGKESSYARTASKRSIPKDPKEKKKFLNLVKSTNISYQLNAAKSGGVFNAVSQKNMQNELQQKDRKQIESEKSRELYNYARKELIKLRGGSLNSIPEFDKAKIGVSRNGQKRPASDIARTVSNIADLVSRKSKLLLSLEKVLSQTLEVVDMSESGRMSFSPSGLISENNKNSFLYNYLIEDDTKNILGHRSGERFIIKDEHIISATFEEKPPHITTVSVSGTEPIVGEQGGNLANVPVYIAYGADFDLWRQYGWRNEQAYSKPFFWSAELQCAPYAKMLLSRQRRNIVTGSVTVMGNEYYQLGDVVYITHRNMLYYVEAIQHNFSYNNSFSTTLTLKYGHAPGEYIPTPLDVIGKNLIAKGQTHSAYRMRRESPVEDFVVGVIKFSKGGKDLFKGAEANRNFEELRNASLSAKKDINFDEWPSQSSKLYILSFGGDKNLQKERAEELRNWFNNPYKPGEAMNGIGKDGVGPGSLISGATKDKEIGKYQINHLYVAIDHINQIDEYEDLTNSEKELLRSGLIASQKTRSIDNTLENVIELRLRQPPKNGWEK